MAWNMEIGWNLKEYMRDVLLNIRKNIEQGKDAENACGPMQSIQSAYYVLQFSSHVVGIQEQESPYTRQHATSIYNIAKLHQLQQALRAG